MGKITKKISTFSKREIEIISIIIAFAFYAILIICEIFNPYMHLAKGNTNIIIIIIAKVVEFIILGTIAYVIYLEIFFLLNQYKAFLRNLKKFSWIICIIFIFFTSIFWYNKILVSKDYEKVSKEEYITLENMVKSASTREDLFLYANSFEKDTENNIIANFESNKCKITVYYDENFEIVNTEYEESSSLYPFMITAFFIFELGSILAFIVIYNQIFKRFNKTR